MKNKYTIFTKKKYLVSALLILFVGLGIYLFNNTDDSKLQQQEQTQISTVKIKIDYGNGEIISYETEIKEAATAFSVLEKAVQEKEIPIETQQYDFGVFVKSINNLESDTNLSWIYFVNGTSGNVAADQKILQPGDLVEWKYIEPEM